MALFFYHRSEQLNIDYVSVKAEMRTEQDPACVQRGPIERREEAIVAEDRGDPRFLSTRTLWTNYLAECYHVAAAQRADQPSKGNSSLKTAKSRGEKKSLSFTADSAVLSDGIVPREMGEFLVALRNHPDDETSSFPLSSFPTSRKAKPAAAPGGIGEFRHRLPARDQPRRTRSLGVAVGATETAERRTSPKNGLLERLHHPTQLRSVLDRDRVGDRLRGDLPAV